MLGLLFLALLSPFRVGKRWKERHSETVVTETVLRYRSWLRTRYADSVEDQETSPLLPGDRLGTQYS